MFAIEMWLGRLARLATVRYIGTAARRRSHYSKPRPAMLDPW